MKLTVVFPSFMSIADQIEEVSRINGYVCHVGYRLENVAPHWWRLKMDLGGNVSPKVCGDFVRDFYSEGFDYYMILDN